MSQVTLAAAVLRSRHLRSALAWGLGLIVLMPLLMTAVISGVIAEQQAASCASPESEQEPASGQAVQTGLYAAPLALRPGRSYRVGATVYGGPGDPTSGDYGSIPDPAQSYLPSHPDSFAELSVLARNPANAGAFAFSDANALDRLAYMSGLRVSHGGRSELLYKRDIGYGQGPGQYVASGQPYRIDLWWQAAQALGVNKDAVDVTLLPPSGAAGVLEALPQDEQAQAEAVTCPVATYGASAPLPLSPGIRTTILPSGLAAGGEEAPLAVKQMVAAGNRLYGTAYLYGGGHGVSLDSLQAAYDCSSAVSYLLHAAGALGESSLDSTQLESYGQPGPGRYVSIYANAAHAFIFLAGLRLDTVEASAYDSGPNAGKQGPRWRVSATVPDWARWIVRHPIGL